MHEITKHIVTRAIENTENSTEQRIGIGPEQPENGLEYDLKYPGIGRGIAMQARTRPDILSKGIND